jgi:hypothetical protein
MRGFPDLCFFPLAVLEVELSLMLARQALYCLSTPPALHCFFVAIIKCIWAYGVQVCTPP